MVFTPLGIKHAHLEGYPLGIKHGTEHPLAHLTPTAHFGEQMIVVTVIDISSYNLIF